MTRPPKKPQTHQTSCKVADGTGTPKRSVLALVSTPAQYVSTRRLDDVSMRESPGRWAKSASSRWSDMWFLQQVKTSVFLNSYVFLVFRIQIRFVLSATSVPRNVLKRAFVSDPWMLSFIPCSKRSWCYGLVGGTSIYSLDGFLPAFMSDSSDILGLSWELLFLLRSVLQGTS